MASNRATMASFCVTGGIAHEGLGRPPRIRQKIRATEIPASRFVSLNSRNHFPLPHEPAWATFIEDLNAFLPADGKTGRSRGLALNTGLGAAARDPTATVRTTIEAFS